MNEIKIYQSISGNLNENLSTAVDFLNKKLEVKTSTGYIHAAVNYTAKGLINAASAPFHALISVAALVESVVRHTIATVLKALTFILPAGWSKTLDEKAIVPLFNHGKLSSEASLKSFVRIFTNFISEKSRKKVDEAIAFDTFYNNAFSQKLIHFHITGDSRNDGKIDPAIIENTETVAEKAPVQELPETPAPQTETPQVEKKRFWSIETLKNAYENVKSHLPSKRTTIIGAATAVGLAAISYIAYRYLGSSKVPTLQSKGFLTGQEPIASRDHVRNFLANHSRVTDEPASFAKDRLAKLASVFTKKLPNTLPTCKGFPTGQEPIASKFTVQNFLANHSRVTDESAQFAKDRLAKLANVFTKKLPKRLPTCKGFPIGQEPIASRDTVQNFLANHSRLTDQPAQFAKDRLANLASVFTKKLPKKLPTCKGFPTGQEPIASRDTVRIFLAHNSRVTDETASFAKDRLAKLASVFTKKLPNKLPICKGFPTGQEPIASRDHVRNFLANHSRVTDEPAQFAKDRLAKLANAITKKLPAFLPKGFLAGSEPISSKIEAAAIMDRKFN